MHDVQISLTNLSIIMKYSFLPRTIIQANTAIKTADFRPIFKCTRNPFIIY